MPIVHTTDPRCIPRDTDGFAEQWWYAVWDHPLPQAVLPQVGHTIFLADPDGVVRWETQVVATVAVPYEHTMAFVDHVAAQFGQPVGVMAGGLPAPGFGFAWMAAPVREMELPTALLGVELGDWASTDDLPADLALLLGFPHADDPVW